MGSIVWNEAPGEIKTVEIINEYLLGSQTTVLATATVGASKKAVILSTSIGLSPKGAPGGTGMSSVTLRYKKSGGSYISINEAVICDGPNVNSVYAYSNCLIPISEGDIVDIYLGKEATGISIWVSATIVYYIFD